ncbi:ATP-grasp domain-containing protein [Candidatus Dojkabacteria bacterium]|nr:ATP-grasp domain-containing protein [Candidatus Dojkabacteria bacterium]
MDDLNSIVKKINNKIGTRDYFYISNEVEHGLGLADLIHNFKSVCLNYVDIVDYLYEDKRDIFCLLQHNQKTKVRTSAGLLSYLTSNPLPSLIHDWNFNGACFQTFKISPKFENLVSDLGGVLVNTPARLNRLFELKISQSRLLGKGKINIPKTYIGVLGKFDYDDLVNKLGSNFVIQYNRGHTGQGTKFIKSQKAFNEIKDLFPKREVRVLEYIKGQTYSINCCMGKNRIFIGGIYKQITGIPELTSKKGATVGGTWNHGLPEEILEKLKIEISKLEILFKQNNYLGLFGFDFIYNSENQEVKIIEINARQQMTVAFNSQINLLQGLIPLNLLHIVQILNVDIDVDIDEYNKIGMEEIDAGQLYFRNQADISTDIKKEIRTGEYKPQIDSFDHDSIIKQTYKIKEISEENVLLYTRKYQEEISPGHEVARIQVKNNLFDKSGKLDTKYVKFVSQVGNSCI